MAELLIKIGSGANYQCGDILCAFNDRRIRAVHAEKLCALDGYNSDGLRCADSLAHYLRAYTHQFLFRRVSRDHIERVDLATMEVETFGPPDIFVVEFLAHQTCQANHAIFGTAGQEFWYGGTVDASNEKLDAVWSAIETHSDRQESEEEFSLWPMGRLDIRHHLALRVEDFDEARAGDLVAPVMEEETLLHSRQHGIDWSQTLDDLQVTANEVLDCDCAIGSDLETHSVSKECPRRCHTTYLTEKVGE